MKKLIIGIIVMVILFGGCQKEMTITPKYILFFTDVGTYASKDSEMKIDYYSDTFEKYSYNIKKMNNPTGMSTINSTNIFSTYDGAYVDSTNELLKVDDAKEIVMTGSITNSAGSTEKGKWYQLMQGYLTDSGSEGFIRYGSETEISSFDFIYEGLPEAIGTKNDSIYMLSNESQQENENKNKLCYIDLQKSELSNICTELTAYNEAVKGKSTTIESNGLAIDDEFTYFIDGQIDGSKINLSLVKLSNKNEKEVERIEFDELVIKHDGTGYLPVSSQSNANLIVSDKKLYYLNSEYFYTLDAMTGAVVSKIEMPESSNIMEYQIKNDAVYLVVNTNDTPETHILKVDPTGVTDLQTIEQENGFLAGFEVLD